jgi:hypothetical protein
MKTLDPYFVVRNDQLQLYLQQFRDIDVQNRNTYSLEDELHIGRKGLGLIATKFNKVIICFITGKYTTNKLLARRAAIYFPDSKHHFYYTEVTFKRQFKTYRNYVNDENHTDSVRFRLPLLSVCIGYYNKFINQDSPTTEDSAIEFILSALLKNTAVITLVICKTKVTSLLFKTNKTPGYVDDKLEQQFNMKFTPKTVILSLNIKKDKQDLQKQIDDVNVLISKYLLFIKYKQNECRKNRNELKKLIYKLD